MKSPLTDFRNFKKTRKEANTDNVEHSGVQPVTHLYHARANEADIEVTIVTETETLTCEINTMNNVNNNVEQIRANIIPTIENACHEMNNVADAINEALGSASVQQEETVSISSAAERYKTLRRYNLISSVSGNVAATAGLAIGAALNGRDVKRATILGCTMGAVSIGYMALSKYNKNSTRVAADYMTDEEVRETAKPRNVVLGALTAVGVGAVMGALFIRKVVTATEE